MSSFSPGSRLGPYEISGKLGEGGMGEVWRAKDAHLGREVALKVLPEGFTQDPERLARFEREAKLLAQLNHPNIAQIYGLEVQGDRRALVMELVEGPTLAERLESCALPLNESLSVSLQIAQALEEAHEKGIVHRDLKPQNIKASIEGKVKVLDFGLAKAMDPTAASAGGGASASQLAKSPTLTLGATVQGMILGTAAYMAPEQARGLPVDKRADIWAFGVVLYEMLAGRRLFEGELVSDVLAGVLRQEVDWGALPEEVPAAIRSLLRRCLERNPKNRLHDIADARIVIEEVLSGRSEEAASTALSASAPAVVSVRGIGSAWLVAGVVGVLAIGLALGALLPRGEAVKETELRFPIALPAGWRFADADTPVVAISRDGKRRVVAVADVDGKQALFLGESDRIAWRELPGTDGARSPFFSPDGRWVGYFSATQVLRVAVDGGPPLPVTATGNQVRGAVWLPDGSIVFSPDAADPLWRIPAEGGEAKPLTTLDVARQDRTHRWPDALPDGSAVLFTCDSISSTEFYDDATIDAVVVATGERKTILRGSSQARYLDPGVLVYARGGALFAVRFDPKRLEVSGAPVPVMQDVATTVASGAVQFAVGADGSLVWIPGAAELTGNLPVRIDRHGVRSQPIVVGAGTYAQSALSPDGKRLALAANDGGTTELWIVDLERGSRSRLTFEGDVGDPTWTPDSRRVAYVRSSTSMKGGADVYWKLADGSGEAEPLVAGPGQEYPGSFAPDGMAFIFERSNEANTDSGIYILHLGSERREEPLLESPAREFAGRVCPDGRWLAYLSAESGRTELFVRPFPAGQGKWQISTAGAVEPHWSHDGRELFFRNAGTLFRTAIDSGRGFVAGSPERIATGFRSGTNDRTYTPTADGLGFVALPGWEIDYAIAQVNFALGWRREVTRLFEAKQ